MPYKVFPGKLDGTGATVVQVQQDNASTEWDIYQISVNGTTTVSPNMTAQILLNGFLLCNTPHAVADTATGPPDVILARSDILSVVFINGGAGDQVNVGVWFNENPAGTTTI